MAEELRDLGRFEDEAFSVAYNNVRQHRSRGSLVKEAVRTQSISAESLNDLRDVEERDFDGVVFENAEGVLKEDWVATKLGEEEAQSRDDGDGSPVQKVLRGGVSCGTSSQGRRKTTHPKLMTDVRRDRLADKEAQSLSDSFHLARVASDKTCDFAGHGGNLEALGEVNGDRWAESPRDASCLTPSSLARTSA